MLSSSLFNGRFEKGLNCFIKQTKKACKTRAVKKGGKEERGTEQERERERGEPRERKGERNKGREREREIVDRRS